MTEDIKTTEASAADKAKLSVAVVLVIAGLAGYYVLARTNLWLRWAAVAAGLVVAGVILALSAYGRQFRQFMELARIELRKVVWPTYYSHRPPPQAPGHHHPARARHERGRDPRATFFDTNTFFVSRDEGELLQLVPQRLRGEIATFEIRIGDQVIVEEGRRITARHVRQLEDAKVTRLRVPREYVYGKILAHDVVNTETGEIIAKANEVLTAASVEKLIEAGIADVKTLYVNDLDRGVRTSPPRCRSSRAARASRRWSKSTA